MVSRSECSHLSVWVAVLLLLCSCLPELSLGVPHGKLPSRADLSPESLLSKPYSVGFEIEHKLLLDFAQSAEARARFVGRDFKEIAAAAKEEHDDEVKRSIEGERHLQTFLADREARKAGRELELSRRQRRANARVAELESRVAQLKARQAELEAQTANEVAAKAQAKAATSKKEHETIIKKELHALKMRKAKTTLALAAANAKVKALKTGTVPSAAAAISKKSVIAGKPTSTKLSAKSAPTSSATGKAKSAVTSALKTATLAANKIASTAKKAVTAPVATSGNKKSLLQTSHSTESTAESTAEAEATAESESTAELLTTESPAIVVPDWPQLDDPHNVATEVRILNNGKPEVFKQPDATLAENLTKFAKHTGRQSYTEHFQQWPTATPTPAPAAQSEPVVKPTVATPAAPKITRVANPEPTPVAKKVSKFNLWIIVAIVSGVMFLCLIGAIIFLIRKKRKEGELEVGTGAEINQGYQTV